MAVAGLTSLALACARAPIETESLSDLLQQQLHHELDEELTVGATLGVDLHREVWTGASGFADPLGRQVLRPSDRFRIGSITKTFTAVLVLQLVEEGFVDLDDSIEKWFPDVPGASQITVRSLLNHTSGLYNYTEDPRVAADLSRVWNPQELIAIAEDHGLLFTPGTQWSYSNTNYVLLGLLIERVTGFPYVIELRQRLLNPIGLSDTFLEGAEDIPGGLVHGTLRSGYAYLDFSESLHPSVVWSAGGMVSNAADLLAFSEALFGGKLLGDDMLAEMTTPVALPDGSDGIYGFGLVTVQTDWGPYYWHNGKVNGYTSYFGYFPERDTTVTALVNTSNSEAWAIADGALRLLFQDPTAEAAIAVN